MRHYTVLSMLVAASVAALVAQGATADARPRKSPHESTAQTVDGADISVNYGRPYMRGRTIMGALVPYGIVWCPGADEATTLTTNRGLKVGDLQLTAGSYTLWMLPSADEWTLIVNRQTGQWHTRYDARYDLGRVVLIKRTLGQPVDQLTFAIEKNPAGAGGILKMSWELTEVSAPFTVTR